jgi:hypothetical protein
MNKITQYAALIPALTFLVMGLTWLINPTAAALDLGMVLQEGIGRSSQLGDMTAFFIGNSTMIALAFLNKNRTWLHASALIVALAATFRVVAWLFHDASLAIDLIVAEVIFAGLILLSASKMKNDAKEG